MAEYTPTTDEVRAMYVTGTPPHHVSVTQGNAEFDRWLAAHDREVAASAWDACAASVVHEDGTPVEIVANNNPYQAITDALEAKP